MTRKRYDASTKNYKLKKEWLVSHSIYLFIMGICDITGVGTPFIPKKIENVGEEFMIWAEKGWAFERIVSKGLGDSESESCPYPLYREYFVNKINELVEQKIKSL